METSAKWPFHEAPDSTAVTTKHVTEKGLPILYVSRDLDEDGEVTWQFQCLTIPFDLEDAQIVRLDTIVRLDPSVVALSELPIGYAATRTDPAAEWRLHREQ